MHKLKHTYPEAVSIESNAEKPPESPQGKKMCMACNEASQVCIDYFAGTNVRTFILDFSVQQGG